MEESRRHRIVTSYDFKHPARVNKDQLRTLENLHDNFARLLSSTFSGAMNAVVDVDTAFVDQTTYAEFIKSLSNPSCSYQFTLGPTNGQAIIDIAMPVVYAFVDRIFGGKGSSRVRAFQGREARQLSHIEMGVIAKIAKRVVEDLEATWEPILRVEISDIELETNPEFMQITAASEIVILLAFEINSTNASGLVSLCYPFFTLESILPRLGPQTYVRMGRTDSEETIRQNRARLANTYVPLRAELGSATISLGAARRLQVGDVVKLETLTDEPTVIYVGDEPKYLGVPFAGPHDRMTVKIARVIPPLEEELFKSPSGFVPPKEPAAKRRSQKELLPRPLQKQQQPAEEPEADEAGQLRLDALAHQVSLEDLEHCLGITVEPEDRARLNQRWQHKMRDPSLGHLLGDQEVDHPYALVPRLPRYLRDGQTVQTNLENLLRSFPQRFDNVAEVVSKYGDEPFYSREAPELDWVIVACEALPESLDRNYMEQKSTTKQYAQSYKANERRIQRRRLIDALWDCIIIDAIAEDRVLSKTLDNAGPYRHAGRQAELRLHQFRRLWHPYHRCQPPAAPSAARSMPQLVTACRGASCYHVCGVPPPARSAGEHTVPPQP